LNRNLLIVVGAGLFYCAALEWQLHISKADGAAGHPGRGDMRIGFSRLLLSVMLLFPLSAGVLAQSSSVSSGQSVSIEQATKKEKAQIVAVKKREAGKQNSGGTKKAKGQ
jgi:hypothetical protein